MFCKNRFSYKIDNNFDLNFTYKLVVILYQYEPIWAHIHPITFSIEVASTKFHQNLISSFENEMRGQTDGRK